MEGDCSGFVLLVGVKGILNASTPRDFGQFNALIFVETVQEWPLAVSKSRIIKTLKRQFGVDELNALSPDIYLIGNLRDKREQRK